jgi:hypothetical protein
MNQRDVEKMCDQGIAALIALYGECPAEDYEPGCMACRASMLIRDMRELRASGRAA